MAEDFDNAINRSLSFLDNKFLSYFIKMLLILYIVLIAHKLPDFMIELLRNNFIRVILLFMVVWMGNKDYTIGLLISIAFIMSMNYINNLDMRKQFEELDMIDEMEDRDYINVPQQQEGAKLEINEPDLYMDQGVIPLEPLGSDSMATF